MNKKKYPDNEKMVALTLRIPLSLRNDLRIWATLNAVPVKYVVRDLIKAHLDKSNKEVKE